MPIELLELENFRSHALTSLPLADIPAATFVGLVGSGKSSFQEAFRWCLFGEADCADRGYIKLGATKCRVTAIVRTLAGSRYRITRTQSVNGSNLKTDLQLQAANGGGGWTPVGAKAIRETEAKIRAEVAAMDYDTLISSSISPQGRSSMFTRPPKIYIDGKYYEGRAARMQIFAQSEGLGVWEERRKAAMKAANAVEQEAATLEAQVVAADAELARREDVTLDLGRAETIIRESREDAASIAERIEQAGKDLATLEARIPAARRELAGFAEDRQAKWSKEKARREKRSRVEAHTAILARRPEIEQAAARVQELDASLSADRQQLAGIAEAGRGLTEQVTAAERSMLETSQRADAALTRLAEAQGKVRNRPALEQKVARLAAARTERHDCGERIRVADEEITKHRESLDRTRRANQEATKRRGKIETEERGVKTRIELNAVALRDKEQRAKVMETVPCLGMDALTMTCPLLADARVAADLLPQLRAEHATLCAWVRPDLPTIYPTDETEAFIGRLQSVKLAEDRKRMALDAELAALQPAEAELAALDTIAASLPGLEAERQAADEAHDAAVTALAALKEARDAKAYDYRCLKIIIEDNEKERLRLLPDAALLPQLAHAAADLPGLEAEIRALDAEIAGLETRLAREAEIRTWLAEAEQSVATRQADLQTWRADLADLRQREREAVNAAAAARATLATLARLAADRERAASEAARLRKRHALLTALTVAYKQIPLMILETQAIPDVEEEASRILAKISRNGMRTRLATYREVKSRDELADGLDIFVTDRLGERTYENFSGGQKSQIDLAYRLALVKRQARRTAGGLGILWLDEPIETQDAGDLPPIIDLFREIAQGWVQTFVTTHVEGAKETFPAQVVVDGGDGRDSRAELVTA